MAVTSIDTAQLSFSVSGAPIVIDSEDSGDPTSVHLAIAGGINQHDVYLDIHNNDISDTLLSLVVGAETNSFTVPGYSVISKRMRLNGAVLIAAYTEADRASTISIDGRVNVINRTA